MDTETAVAPHVAVQQPELPVPFPQVGGIALPPSWTVADFKDTLPAPLRPKGMSKVLSLIDLRRMTGRFGSPVRSLVMVDLSGAALVACTKIKAVSYFEAGSRMEVGWSDWGSVHELEHSMALKRLMAFVQQGGDHRALVRLLDALVDYLVEPEAAVIHDAVGKLSLTKQVKFNRAEDLGLGDVAISFETITGASSEAGRVRLPESLTFEIPVVLGLEAQWYLKFKLRYVLKDDGVTFRLECEELAESAATMAAEIMQEMAAFFDGVAEVYSGTL
jgi:uncharacterized protein YfdQ (DUF2303 family)